MPGNLRGICTKRCVYRCEESSVFVVTQIVNASRLPYQLPWCLNLSAHGASALDFDKTRAR
jgi:hypothetical protein